ncbi:MAG: hypothetical protein NT062_37450 [Proteobacteria bacterium]|nr:hypothetical protein [Pseudomonadota bacterium]
MRRVTVAGAVDFFDRRQAQPAAARSRVATTFSRQASFINYCTCEINVKIATTAATENLKYIYDKTNPDAKGKLIQLASDQGDRTLFADRQVTSRARRSGA